jgi:hypothetical protein
VQKNPLQVAFEIHVRYTPYDAFVFESKIPITKLPKQLARVLGCGGKVSATTRAIKHLYDKRTAQEFDAVIQFIPKIFNDPDKIYRNKDGKRGNFCFLKNIRNVNYLASCERIARELQLVTAFQIRNNRYLNDYDLLRSWRDDTHSS